MISTTDIRSLGIEIQEAAVESMFRLNNFDLDNNSMKDYWEEGYGANLSSSERWSWGMEKFSHVPGLFERFLEPNPHSFRSMASRLLIAEQRLRSNDASHINSASMEVVDWSGSAQEAFESNYIGPFEGLRAHHIDLITQLRCACEAEVAIIDESRKSAWEAGNAALDAIRGLESSYWGNSTDSVAFMLTVFGLIGSIARAGTVLGPLFTIIGLANTAAKPQDGSVEGNNAMVIVDELANALNTIQDGVEQQEQEIASALNASIDDIALNYNSLVPPPPQLAKIDPNNPGTDLIPPVRG